MWTDEALPMTAEGATYVTEQMVAEQPELSDFLRRTHNSWTYDPFAQVFWMRNLDDD